MAAYEDFTSRLKLLFSKNLKPCRDHLEQYIHHAPDRQQDPRRLGRAPSPNSSISTCMTYKSRHVGKDLYRAKANEEDISVRNEITREEIPISLKAYGDGPLQLSTDKSAVMFPALTALGTSIAGDDLAGLWAAPAFSAFGAINILPLIYDEKAQRCNILVFDSLRARQAVRRATLESAGGRRKHPVYRFYDQAGGYVCEVRYGDATANALQRGLWTHTRKGLPYFNSLTDGWVSYAHNRSLIALFSHALVATRDGHEKALDEIKADIERIKNTTRPGHA